jgi:glycosyltransferase involved in cell wall biosynthesis
MLIATLTYNRLELTKRMFAALYEHYDLKEGSRHIVVDNGSTDGTLEWLAECVYVDEVIPLGKNLGAAMGHNVIAAAALESGDDLVLSIENDWLCRSPCLQASKQLLEDHPTAVRIAYWQAHVAYVRNRIAEDTVHEEGFPHRVRPIYPSFPVSLVRREYLSGRFPVAHERNLRARGRAWSILPETLFFDHMTGPLSWQNRGESYREDDTWIW